MGRRFVPADGTGRCLSALFLACVGMNDYQKEEDDIHERYHVWDDDGMRMKLLPLGKRPH